MKKINVISLVAASALVGGMVDLKDTEVVKGLADTGDVESVQGKMDLATSGVVMDAENVEAGLNAVATALSFVNSDNTPVALQLGENSKKFADLEAAEHDADLGDLEYFEPSDPSILKPFAFALSANSLNGDAGLDLMYPTVNIPSNVEGALLTIPYGFVKSKFSRDDAAISGETRLNAKSVLSGLRNPTIVNSDANLLVPVSNAKNDSYLDVTDFKTENYKHPTTGESITTAPILFDKKFDLTTIAHTTKLVSEGVFGDETSLDIGGQITYVYGKIAGDAFKFDVSSLPMNEIIAGGSGDNKDLVINISTENFIIDPTSIKKFDGTASDELAKIPNGLRLVYALDINGNGNEQTCDFGVRKPTLKLLKVINVKGETVDMTDGEGKTAADVGNGLTLTSFDLNQTVTNADLRIVANVIDVGEYAQRIGVGYGSVDAYERTILSDKKPAVANTLLSIATIRSLTRKRDLQLSALKKTLRNGATNVNGGKTKNLTSVVILPYSKESNIDLSGMLDSEEHSERGADIAGLIAGKIATIIPSMVFDTDYAALTKVYGRGTIGIGVTFGSELLPFMPTELTMPGVEVKFAVTEIDELKSDIFVYPIDLNHNANELTPLNFGVRLAKPDLVVSGVYNKVQGTYVVPRNRVETLVDILHHFKVSNISGAMDKITSNVSK